MKLIVDIPHGLKEAFNHEEQWTALLCADMRDVLQNGIPLDDIKAEIREEKEFAYADFERYKVECLGQDWEDAYDSLPQDDFRYGMGRCLEIIERHIGERSDKE